MEISTYRILGIIFASALATFSLRALPFAMFSPKRGIPKIVCLLGDKLPSAVMATLVVYCLKGISGNDMMGSLQLIIASVVVCIIHIWKKNTILSISVGTICYMMLIRFM